MQKVSAGLVMFRRRNGQLQFLLAHPGGPFWRQKDTGAWTIPKGEIEPGEAPLAAARREFEEEVGFRAEGDFMPLEPITQTSGKLVHAWGFEGDCDPSTLRSGTFRMEWPPQSGLYQDVPEVDRAEFFDLPTARKKINPAQIALLEEVARRLARAPA